MRWGFLRGWLQLLKVYSLCTCVRVCVCARVCVYMWYACEGSWVHVYVSLSFWMWEVWCPVVLQSERNQLVCVWFILVSSIYPPLSCHYPHGGYQAWRQWSVLSYTLRLLFVEKAGGAHTMVKVMLNVPFRNNSSIWTDIAPAQNKATCRQSWD